MFYNMFYNIEHCVFEIMQSVVYPKKPNADFRQLFLSYPIGCNKTSKNIAAYLGINIITQCPTSSCYGKIFYKKIS